MSTIDSLLLVASSAITRDIYQQLRGLGISPSHTRARSLGRRALAQVIWWGIAIRMVVPESAR
jgi:Na+/proline symporter